MHHNELLNNEIIQAIGSLSGLTLQIHKDFKPLFVTEGYAQLYGFSTTEEFMNLGSIMDLIPDDLKDVAIKRYQQVILHGDSPVMTVKTQRVDGSEFWVKLHDRRLKVDDGYGIMTVLIDINDEVEAKLAYERAAAAEKEARTELINLQSLVIESEKQTALNHLLAGVSHQFNTPLGNIRTSASNVEAILTGLLSQLRTKKITQSYLSTAIHDAQESMAVIDTSVIKATKLIKNVKYMVKDNRDEDKSTFRFGPIVQDTIKLFIGGKTEVDVTVDVDVPDNLFTAANPNTWMQVFSVFCENALNHGFQGREEGRISVAGFFDGDEFVVQIQDDGKGIEPEKQSRIFEPFYSSNMSDNSGLGLALVYNLVTRNLSGQIQATSIPEISGTRFDIRLPAAAFFTLEDTSN